MPDKKHFTIPNSRSVTFHSTTHHTYHRSIASRQDSIRAWKQQPTVTGSECNYSFHGIERIKILREKDHFKRPLLLMNEWVVFWQEKNCFQHREQQWGEEDGARLLGKRVATGVLSFFLELKIIYFLKLQIGLGIGELVLQFSFCINNFYLIINVYIKI